MARQLRGQAIPAGNMKRAAWWLYYMGGGSGGGGAEAPAAMIYDNISASSIQLYWSPVSGATNYVVQQDEVEVYSGANTTVVISSGITAGETYSFRVKADESDWTTISVTIPAFHNALFVNDATGTLATAARQTALEPTSSSTVDKAYSWSCWFRILNDSQLEATKILFMNGAASPGTTQQYSLGLITDGIQSATLTNKVRFLIATTANLSSNYITIDSSVNLKKNRDYFIVITYSGSEVNTGFKMYFNGVEDTGVTRNTVGTYTGAVNDANNRFQVGNPITARQMRAYMRDMCIWNAALSQANITEMYNAGVPPSVPGLSFYASIIAYWSLQSSGACFNNATYNLSGTPTISSIAIRPSVQRLSWQRGTINNTRYVAFGSFIKLGDNLNVYMRSGTSHVLNGRIDKIIIPIASELPGSPATVYTDGVYDLREAIIANINSQINLFTTQYDGDFIDTLRLESTDGTVGAAWGTPEVMDDSSLFAHLTFGKIIEANGKIVVPFYGFNEAETNFKLLLFVSEDNGATFDTVTVYDGANSLTEHSIVYQDGIWLMLARKNNSDRGIYQAHSTDDLQTWSTPVLTNLAAESAVLGENSNCDIELNSVGRLNVVVMDRSTDYVRLSKNNYIHDVIDDPTSWNTPANILRSYTTDSTSVLGYPMMRHLGDEVYAIVASCEQSSSRADMYFAIGKINEV